MRVLMITSEWPSSHYPFSGRFVRQQATYLERAGVDIEVLPFRGKGNPVNYFTAWFDVRRCLGRYRPDVVHAQFGQSGLLAIPTRVPLVVTFRGSDLLGIISEKTGRRTKLGTLLRVLSRFVSTRADEIILVSEGMSRALGRRDFHVIPSGLDLELFRPMSQVHARRHLGMDEAATMVLFGGDPSVARKRFWLASQACKLIQKQFPSLCLIPLGGIQHDQMPFLMNACDALLLTSAHEGSPNVVKEALACDIPVVSVDVGDVRGLLTGIDGCITCADDSTQTVASALADVLTAKVRIDGRRHVEHLDEARLAKEVIGVYRMAIARRTGISPEHSN